MPELPEEKQWREDTGTEQSEAGRYADLRMVSRAASQLNERKRTGIKLAST